MLKQLTEQLTAKTSLTAEQAKLAVRCLVDEHVAAEDKAEFLTALAQKGESTEEITTFAVELRALATQPPLDAETRAREILDVCGTGGDRLNTFNISSSVSLVVASAGVTVAKHGNRAITSRSGSADVLEALGIPIEQTPEQAAAALRDHHFAFFFAQNYHPSFKFIGPARKLCATRGQRTIFNFLGPLLNPVRPTAQLVGVARPQLCEPVAHVLQTLGIRRAMVVCGSVGDAWLDELSTLGENHVAEFYQDRAFHTSTLFPGNHPLQPASLVDLAGGDVQANAQIVRQLLAGEDRGPKRDAVLLNAAAGLFVAGKVKSLVEGWELAGDLIDSGKAKAKLAELATNRK